MGASNVVKAPPSQGVHSRGRGRQASRWLPPRVTGIEATAPKRRAFTPNEGRALAPGTVGLQDLQGQRVGRRGGQSSNLGSGVGPCGSLSRASVCPRGGGWGYLVEDVVGQAPRGSGWYPGAGVLLRGLGGTRVQRDRPGGRRWLWPGLGVMQGTENWLWSLASWWEAAAEHGVPGGLLDALGTIFLWGALPGTLEEEGPREFGSRGSL